MVTASCGNSTLLEQVNSLPDQFGKLMGAFGVPVEQSGGQQQVDTRALAFRFDYHPNGSGVSLRKSAIPQKVTLDAFGNGATITPAEACVFLRVTVDGQGRDGVESDSCSFVNVASTSFGQSVQCNPISLDIRRWPCCCKIAAVESC